MNRRSSCAAIAALLSDAVLASIAIPIARAAEATQRVAHMGFVDSRSPSTPLHGTSAFWERLRELGWFEGKNLLVERRWAEGRIDRLPALLSDLVAHKVDIIVTMGTPAATAAKNATSTTPIVMAGVGDPVGTGLATSLARPGGNLTGVSFAYAEGVFGKWLELLQETVPNLTVVAVISNPDSQFVQNAAKQLAYAAQERPVKLRFIALRNPEAIGPALKQARQQAQAMLLLSDPLTTTYRKQITALAARYRIPAMYSLRDFADDGGLMAYAPDPTVAYRRTAEYVDAILNGANPADLPIEQPTKFELVVNLKTAKALGLTIPESILLRADEVIR